MTQTNISVVINNYFTGNSNNGVKMYSVIVSHESEVHENYLYTDRAKAIAKMEEIRNSWENDSVTIHKYRENRGHFTPQYATKLGYWYENNGYVCKNGLWEYGYVEVLECVLE
jgi:hypothetical protein